MLLKWFSSDLSARVAVQTYGIGDPDRPEISKGGQGSLPLSKPVCPRATLVSLMAYSPTVANTQQY